MRVFKVHLGNRIYDGADIFLNITHGINILCIAMPRYGKGAICKHLTVQISKHKKVCVFDYKGEWSNHITKHNKRNPRARKMDDYFIAQKFTFKINDFNKIGDWAGFGFSMTALNYVYQVATSNYHHGDLETVHIMLSDLPLDSSDAKRFRDKYGITFEVVRKDTKEALLRRFDSIKKYFWYGDTDGRSLINFNNVWGKYKNLIVDLSDKKRGFMDIGVARAYAGLIIREMEPDFVYSKGFYVVEEASELLAEPVPNDIGEATGLSEFHEMIKRMVTLDTKQGVNVLLLAQHRKQIYEKITRSLSVMLIGKLNALESDLSRFELEANDRIDFNRGSKKRWWFLIDVANEKDKQLFVADVPCCEYETNR